MAVGTIPIMLGSYNFEMRIDLGEVIASLRLYYNTRQNMWHMDLRDTNSDAKVLGVALVPNINLVEYNQTSTTRWGNFYLQDTDPNGGPYVKEDLGRRLFLVHWTAADLAQFEEEEMAS